MNWCWSPARRQVLGVGHDPSLMGVRVERFAKMLATKGRRE